MEEKLKVVYSALGKVSDDCAWMIHASDGDVLRAWYNEALQDLNGLFIAVNSRLLDEGRG